MEDLLKIPELLYYPKIARLRAHGAPNYEELEQIVRSSITDPTCIIILSFLIIEISQYGTRLAKFFSRNDRGISNPLTIHSVLSEKYLRRLFTGIELKLYKLCHLSLEGHRSSYHFESSKTAPRINKLKSILSVSNWVDYRSLFDEIFYVRDAFSHSFIDIEDMRYRGARLQNCFGYQHAGAIKLLPLSADHIFMNDVIEFMIPLETAFSTYQMQQIDKNKLFKLCDHLLKERSMVGP